MAFYQNSDLIYELHIKLGGAYIKPEDIDKVEFMFTSIRKLYPSNEVLMVSDGIFQVRLTQEESKQFAQSINIQARVKLKSGRVIPTEIKNAQVQPTLSKEIL